MKLTMQEQVSLVHVFLDEQLILMSVFTSYAKIVFRGDEPAELFEPKHFPILVAVLHHGDLVLFQVSDGCFLSLLDGYHSCVFGLMLLLIRFLFDLKVLTDVKLSGDGEVDLNSRNLVKV